MMFSLPAIKSHHPPLEQKGIDSIETKACIDD